MNLKKEQTTNMIKAIFTLLFVFPPVVSTLGATEITGLEIMTKVDQRDDGDDQNATATYTLMNKRGQKRVRDTIRLWKDYSGKDGFDAKMIVFFNSPPDVKGTGFMSWSYWDDERDDDQWLYLPALRKVRRIASSNKGDYFMGTDFTYDDMGERKVKEDEHALIKSEVYENVDCYVVESKPKKKGYIYSKKISWVDKQKWIVVRVDYYDRKHKFLKTLKTDWQLVQGIWTWEKAVMANSQTGHSTIIETKDVKMNTNIKDEDFVERTLKRGL
jgi:outer membrane lipoprotein-sorting protein